MSHIKKFMKGHPTFDHTNEIASLCAPLSALNITYFSHAHIDAKKQLSGISLDPVFTQLYLEKGYYQYDLHMEDTTVSEQYIIWDSLPLAGGTDTLEQDFTAFNYGHTFSMIYNHGHSKDCYHFATTLGNHSMNEQYIALLPALKKFICYFKEHVAKNRYLKHAYEHKLRVPQYHSGFIIQPSHSLDLEPFNATIPHQRTYINGSDTYLTPREMTCLHEIAQGKTLDDIAITLNITPRTMKAHIRNMKDKLQCDNQFQLGMLYAKLIS